MKIISLIAFGLLCIAQWFVPANMIQEQQMLRAEGKLFRFQTEPVDPADPYRGKYLTLNFTATTVSNAKGDFKTDDIIYVVLGEDSLGFAKIISGSAEMPPPTSDYIVAKVRNTYDDGEVRIDYPFERFYLEESKAETAERLYNEDTPGRVAYAEVYIKEGKSAIVDVKMDGRSVVDIVREYNKE